MEKERFRVLEIDEYGSKKYIVQRKSILTWKDVCITERDRDGLYKHVLKFDTLEDAKKYINKVLQHNERKVVYEV